MSDKRPWHYYALWFVAAVSLALNLVIIYTLLQVRQQAGLAFAQAALSMDAVKNGTIEYSLTVDQDIPLALDVPVKFNVTVPIKKTLPISTVVAVPLELPLIGTRILNVPINTSVPIDLTVNVPIDQTIHVNASIPVKFDVPINLKIAETSFGQGLGEFQLVLQHQADNLGAGGAR